MTTTKWKRGDVVWYKKSTKWVSGRVVRVNGGYYYVRNSRNKKETWQLYAFEMHTHKGSNV